MLNITILANNSIYGNLYYVNIFQNTHLVACDETYMHTPPKSFHPIMDKCHIIGRNKTRGICGIRNRQTKYKMTKSNIYHMDIQHKDYEKYICFLIFFSLTGLFILERQAFNRFSCLHQVLKKIFS